MVTCHRETKKAAKALPEDHPGRLGCAGAEPSGLCLGPRRGGGQSAPGKDPCTVWGSSPFVHLWELEDHGMGISLFPGNHKAPNSANTCLCKV